VLDTVMTGLQVVRTGYAIGTDDSTYEDFPISREADILIGLGLTGVFLASMIYGYDQTSNCERAMIELHDRREASRRRAEVYAPPARPVAPAPGCQYDAQCKGERICVRGQCVEPVAPPVVAPSTSDAAGAAAPGPAPEEPGAPGEPDAASPDALAPAGQPDTDS
jgi:hypothetical protein